MHLLLHFMMGRISIQKSKELLNEKGNSILFEESTIVPLVSMESTELIKERQSAQSNTSTESQRIEFKFL